MVKKDTVTGVHSIGFPVVDRNPVAVQLRYRIRGARVERGSLRLGNGLDQTIEFGGGSLINPGLLFQTQQPYCLKDPQSTNPVGIGGVLGRIKTYFPVT